MIDARTRLKDTELDYFRLASAQEAGLGEVGRLPVTVKVLLEMLLRAAATGEASESSVRALAAWPAPPPDDAEVPYKPARILLQDFTGVPAVVDLAAMRSAMQRAGGDPSRIDPQIPADLVIDHSVQVDAFGNTSSYHDNIEREYQRNGERYALLRWAQTAFDNFTVVPPGMGICHQVNLEHLSRVVQVRDGVAVPDTIVGTDSHTTMVNGLGVLGWGVGGIEAEACMLGQPMYLPPPVVVGVRFHNALQPGATATDLVLTLTELLRSHGVVNKFVEFCGDGLASLTVADRATMSNMCPEYGATSALFPVDDQTLRYLQMTGRSQDLLQLVERYCKEQGLFRFDGAPVPTFSELLDLDLATVEPSLAGPRRPQDRVALGQVWDSFTGTFPVDGASGPGASQPGGGGAAVAERTDVEVENGSVVIAAITSCTNTSNPTVMVAAGLLARNAVQAGLQVAPHVKTSLAPGSRVVTDYLQQAGLLEYLEKLGFYLVGYGCTTCIGNSGPLASAGIEREVNERDLNVAAVLSGNRNFEARIHPLVRASYLASPPLVVAFALAGTLHKDLTRDPLGEGADGRPVMLQDLWPTQAEVQDVVESAVRQEFFTREYDRIYDGDEHWREMQSPTGEIYAWDPDSTYVQEPPYFEGMAPEPAPLTDIEGARCLVAVGDSVTTDHISPAGSIAAASPAGQYLSARGVQRVDFNSYGSRRGNHEVMLRGTFANIRLRNALASQEGWWTRHFPSGEEISIFDASERYRADGVPLIVLTGKEYGSGSSRDWAAKGPILLGVKAVIAESFERIHRSNLVGMGVLPVTFTEGQSRQSLGLDGSEEFAIRGLAGGLEPGQQLDVEARKASGEAVRFTVTARVLNATEVRYLENGGVLNDVLRQLQ
ncbi:MAG: aconitate hydratase AcnA [Candidatus Dormibacteraeota bacterium]|nr:aconitate hydratase AcnA [Candidatus Dormibacteraeota bacterium]MBO0705176.1 aconitate hydratase AcnA [Candidatus Dormibacteraeota bacterium]MBO0762537.1 aconitate hydratase AcnA [Candidatus Dormibacteraeota bacterium]